MTTNPNKNDAAKYLYLLLKLGTLMLTNILFFFGIGLYTMSKFDLPGVTIIIFTFTGVFSGFYFVYKEITKIEDIKND